MINEEIQTKLWPLKEDIDLKFTQLVDLCAVAYVEYGDSEWQTKEATSPGYNRGIRPSSHSRIDFSNVYANEVYKQKN